MLDALIILLLYFFCLALTGVSVFCVINICSHVRDNIQASFCSSTLTWHGKGVWVCKGYVPNFNHSERLYPFHTEADIQVFTHSFISALTISLF